MNEILQKQRQLQVYLGQHGGQVVTSGELCSLIKSMSFYLNQEVVELIEEIGGGRDINKPWKQNYRELYLKPIAITDKVRSEAIDVLKFALNICLLAGITPENIDEEFDKVHNVNLDRIKNGY